MSNQTPQVYYVCCIDGFYLCCNGHLSMKIENAKLFHSSQVAIQHGASTIVRSIQKLGVEYKQSSTILSAVKVLATISKEIGV